jgi:hypothetical protein
MPQRPLLIHTGQQGQRLFNSPAPEQQDGFEDVCLCRAPSGVTQMPDGRCDRAEVAPVSGDDQGIK